MNILYKVCIITVTSILLSGCNSKTKVEEDKTLPLKSYYDIALAYLSSGEQGQAEQYLYSAISKDPENQRLIFFFATCQRSKWNKRMSHQFFKYVIKLDPTTPEGKAAQAILDIDIKTDYKTNFATLEKIQEENPEDPIILWLTAFICRELNKRGADDIYVVKGTNYYSKLLSQMDPGPVLLHHTYANLLDVLKEYEMSIKHRQIAIEMVDVSWTCQGTARTLTGLERYEEADIYYKKAIEHSPSNAALYENWGFSMRKRGKDQESYNLIKKAMELAPENPIILERLGYAANKLAQLPRAKK
jgi:tetratricopeptide (TPR) repeat protein